jgi:hypothetical protein
MIPNSFSCPQFYNWITRTPKLIQGREFLGKIGDRRVQNCMYRDVQRSLDIMVCAKLQGIEV